MRNFFGIDCCEVYIMNKKLRKFTSCKGQSMTEFAVGLVVIILILVGAVDVGRAVMTYLALRDAAQEGALYASINRTDTNGIETHVWGSSTLLTGLHNDASANVSVQISYMGIDTCTGYPIKIAVSYDNFPITTPFFGTFMGRQSISLRGEVVETILQPPCQ